MQFLLNLLLKRKLPKMNVTNQDIANLILSKFPGVPMKVIQIQIADELGVAPATVYNKLCGRSSFSVEELFIVCRRYDISLDRLMRKEESVNKPFSFYSDGLKYKPNTYEEYLQKIINHTDNADQVKDVKAIYLCSQPHMFYLLDFPHLYYLKLFIYNLINWKNSDLYNYHPESFIGSKRIEGMLDKMKMVYHSVPSKDILSLHILSSTVMQVEYLVQSNIIKDAYHFNKIIDSLHGLIDWLEKTATQGYRLLDNGETTSVDVYVNKFINVSNMIVVDAGDSSFMTIQCDAPDVIRTNDLLFVNHVNSWLTDVIEYSTRISKTGGVERKNFIDAQRAEVQKLEAIKF